MRHDDRVDAIDEDALDRSADRLRARCGLTGTVGGLGPRDFVQEALHKLMAGARQLDRSKSVEDNLVAIGQSLIWNARRKHRTEEAALRDATLDRAQSARDDDPVDATPAALRAAMERAERALAAGRSTSRTARDGATFAARLIARIDRGESTDPRDVMKALRWRPARMHAAWRRIKDTLRTIYREGGNDEQS